jgi:hypothetical protein
MRSLTRRRLGVTTTLLGLIGAGVALTATPASAVVGPEVTPVFLPGAANQDCSDLDDAYGGGQTWLEIDVTPGNGTFGPITITNFDGAARTFDWSSTIGIDAVYVKGGVGGSNLYVYAPTAQSPEQFSDDGLTTPGTSGNGVSHMSFCYDESNPTTTTTTTTAPTTTTTSSTTTTTAPTTTTTAPTTTTTSSTTTTTAPTTTTTTTASVLPSSTVQSTTTTAAAQVLGTQVEALAVTGVDNGALVAVSLVLIALGLGLIVLGNGGRLLVPRRR